MRTRAPVLLGSSVVGALMLGLWTTGAEGGLNYVGSPDPTRSLNYYVYSPEVNASDSKSSAAFGVFDETLSFGDASSLYGANIDYQSSILTSKITLNATATVKNLDTRPLLEEEIDGEIITSDVSQVGTYVQLKAAFSVDVPTAVRVYGAVSTFLDTSEGAPLTPGAVFLLGPTPFDAYVNYGDLNTPNPFDVYLELAPGQYELWAFSYTIAGQGAGSGAAVLDVTLEGVPEPATVGVLGLGVLGMLVRRRR